MLIVKRIIIILVISAIIWNSGGYYVCFKAFQLSIREEMERKAESADDKDLVQIKLAIGDISGIIWVKKDKEFIYGGELYDMARKERSGDSDIYFCIRDIREKRLIDNFDVASRKDRHLDLIAEIIQKLTTPVSISQLIPEQKVYLSGYLIFGNHCYMLSTGFATVQIPPPDNYSVESVS